MLQIPKTNGSGLRPVDQNAVKASSILFSQLKAQYSNFKVVSTVDASAYTCHVSSEGKPISSVVVSLPTYLDWDPTHPINQKEKLYAHKRPKRRTAVLQHGVFIEEMLKIGIEVVAIEPRPWLLEGVYTRDIAFVVGSKFIQANMQPVINDQPNPRVAEELTVSGGIKPPAGVIIEGGNVVVDGHYVFVGVGDRTNDEAVTWLKNLVGGEKEVIGIKLKTEVLHLDCVFLPLSPANGASGRALVHPAAFEDSGSMPLLEKIYGRLHEVDPSEVPLLGLNAPCVDHNTRLVSAHSGKVISMLKDFGQKVVKVNMGEIIKAEGGPRCSTMPLYQH